MALPHRHFVVGANLGREGESALQVLKWLRGAPGPEFRATAVYVLDTKAVLKLLEQHDFGHAAKIADGEARAAVVHAGAVDAVDEITVVGGDSVHLLLERVVAERDANTLIIGRDCGRRGSERLGSVGSAILKSLPVATAVVPRTLDERRLAQGPVIVAMTDDAHSVPAYRFAEAAAAARGRQLIALFVVPALGPNAVFPSEAARQEKARQRLEEARASISGWLADSDLGGARLNVVAGVPGPEIIAAAEREGAALVVCGSRRLSKVARVFSNSVSTELAASAPCPVVVVPGV